jgi:hypothetical protein
VYVRGEGDQVRPRPYNQEAIRTLQDPVCRHLLQGDYSSVTQAVSDPATLAHAPTREQVGEALRRMELAGVVETHKAGPMDTPSQRAS